MRKRIIEFKNGKVEICFDVNFETIEDYQQKNKIVIIIDEAVLALHLQKFEGYKTIAIKSSEVNKCQATVDLIINKLLDVDVDKSFLLLAVGGGVITDIVGYVASIYKRGINFAFVPTTILGMVDAAIGGKNGVNVGLYKNMIGTISQPKFILYDYTFLKTLPKVEWINGFAEIIKHACIKDAVMFADLEKNNIDYYINNAIAAAEIIEHNANIKLQIVLQDEFENADRYLLNFGHSFGHAIENKYNLPHGFAISIGMVIAANISEKINNFDRESINKIVALLTQYNLPIYLDIDKEAIFSIMEKDKKREAESINFVLLNKIGNAEVQKISFVKLQNMQIEILQ